MRGPDPNLACGGRLFLLEAEAGELLLEARDAPGAIHDLLLAASPGRMRLRIDVEAQRIALLAPGGSGGELGPVGHDDLDSVVVGMGVGLHGSILAAAPPSSQKLMSAGVEGCGSIAYPASSNKARQNLPPGNRRGMVPVISPDREVSLVL